MRTSKTSWCNVPFCESDPVIRSIKRRVENATGVPLANSEHVQVLQYDPGDFYRQHHDQNAHPHSPWGPRLFTFFLYLNNGQQFVLPPPPAAQSRAAPRSPVIHVLTCVCVQCGQSLRVVARASWSSTLLSRPNVAEPYSGRRYVTSAFLVAGCGSLEAGADYCGDAHQWRCPALEQVTDDDPSCTRRNADTRTQHEALTVTKGQKYAANMWLHQFDFQSALAAGCKNEDLAEWRPRRPTEADQPPDLLTGGVDGGGDDGGDDGDDGGGDDDGGPLGQLGPGGWVVGGRLH